VVKRVKKTAKQLHLLRKEETEYSRLATSHILATNQSET
jgi:hypothetical protein